MSDERFDQLTKAAAATTSRRQALKLVGGGLLAALFGGGLFASRGSAGGNACLPPGLACKVSGDCCPIELPDGTKENACCCRTDKAKSGQPGTCAPRDHCIAINGVCHQ
jgi:hypothetical protein